MPTVSIPRIAKRTIADLPVQGKRVLVRVDYNVPLNEEGAITDDTRIKETLPTIQYLLENGASLVLCAHLGRPKGIPNSQYSLKPVAKRLEELLRKNVQMAPDCVGPEVEKMAQALPKGGILLLENLRFHPEEEANDPAFAKQLASLADVFVQDAFGAVHRAHASTAGVAAILPSAAGLLLAKEIFYLSKAIENPERPFIAILGGAKVSDKIKVIDRLLEKADTILIGGAMAYTFRLAQGYKTGKSLVEPDAINTAKLALEKAKAKNVKFLLPTDDVVATPVKTDKLDKKGKPVIEFQNPRTSPDMNCPDDAAGLDIGPATVKAYAAELASAKTILWNGPMGLFENKQFAAGTNAVAQAVVDATQKNGAKSIIGGGDSVKALNKAKLGDKVTFMSTGGGASLEFLEGAVLPGVAALSDK